MLFTSEKEGLNGRFLKLIRITIITFLIAKILWADLVENHLKFSMRSTICLRHVKIALIYIKVQTIFQREIELERKL